MPSSRRLSRFVLAISAVAPVAAVAVFLRAAFAKHSLLVVGGLIAWEVVLFSARFAGRVYGKLQERWVDRAADWTDAALRRITSRYQRHYRYFLSRIHHDVDLRGLSTWGMYALAMDEVFVGLTLMPQAPHRIPAGPVAGKSVGAVGSTDTFRRSIWETLDKYRSPLAVLGPPGSGKTTLLRHVTLVLCGRQRNRPVPRHWRRKLPVILFLREHVGIITEKPDIALPDVVRETLSRLTKKEPPEWLERQLDEGRCVVMLDGLDEVARRNDRGTVMKWVGDQIARYPRHRFILTSRPFVFADTPLISATV